MTEKATIVAHLGESADALRLAMAASVASAGGFNSLPLEFEMTRAVERSTDHLARAALALRERILAELKA